MDTINKNNYSLITETSLEIDYNSIFWSAIGVNNKVFKYVDIFPSQNQKRLKKEEIEKLYNKYKNIREKKTDEKSHERFLNNRLKDTDVIFNFKTNEILFFTQLLRDIIQDNRDYEFFRDQFFNIHAHCIGFFRNKVNTENILNIFAFQLAYIIKYLERQNLDTKLLKLSMEENSLKPFLNECRKKTKCKADKYLANEMSMRHEALKERFYQIPIYIETIEEPTFKKYISQWKNNKKLPNLAHIFTIAGTLHNINSRQQGADFIQLILIRSLLHIEKEHNISSKMKEGFLEKINFFQKKINSLENNGAEILKLQNKYLTDVSYILRIDPEVLKNCL
ncbi:MAG: hypothetical protein DRG78_12725 [Epsilonproteobacteria bacterium]|nr:MAG: hypothetical protein DRG78_12725 [Campylobacterota bacterium]